jgi:hypothetical protein
MEKNWENKEKSVKFLSFPFAPLLTILAITLFLTLLFFIPLSFSPPRYYCWYYEYFSGPQLCDWWRNSLTNSGSASGGSGGNVWTDDNNVLGGGKGRSYCLYEEKDSNTYENMCRSIKNDPNLNTLLQSWGLPQNPIFGPYYSSYHEKCTYDYYYKEMSLEDTCKYKLGGSSGTFIGHVCKYSGEYFNDDNSDTYNWCRKYSVVREGKGRPVTDADNVDEPHDYRAVVHFNCPSGKGDPICCCDIDLGVVACEGTGDAVGFKWSCENVGGTYYQNVCFAGGNFYPDANSICTNAVDTDPHGRTRNGEYDNGKCKWRTYAFIPGDKLCSYYYNKSGVYGTKADPNYNNNHIGKTRDESYDANSGTCYFDRVKHISIEDLCKQTTNDANAYKKVESGGKILYEICRVKRKAW